MDTYVKPNMYCFTFETFGLFITYQRHCFYDQNPRGGSKYLPGPFLLTPLSSLGKIDQMTNVKFHEGISRGRIGRVYGPFVELLIS